MMSSDAAISTRGLTRYFGEKCAVNMLDISVPRGSVFGFLGRNGSGKTTTIRMLMGMLEPTRGSVKVLGEDCRHLSPQTRGRIGYLSEGHHVYGWMRVRDCGKFQSAFFPNWREDIFQAVLKHFRLDEKTRAKNLSRGERAGLCLAMTLAPDPELLILDDPALGLDAVVRRSLLESMLYVTRREGRTILFSSHLLSDVERVADRVAIIDRGALRACCTLDTLRERVRQVVLHYKGQPPSLESIPGVLRSFTTDREMAVTLANFTDATESALNALPIERMSVTPLSLEDAFISYVSDRREMSFFLHDMGAVK